MVANVARVARPRQGYQAPLATRWQAAIAELGRVAPGVPFNQMVSELALDDLHDLIARHRQANLPPPLSPETLQATEEYGTMCREFNSVALEIKSAQRWLEYGRKDWQHRLLKDITPDCFTVPPLCPTGDQLPDFANVSEARQAQRDLLPRLQFIRGVLARINEAKGFDALPADEQAIELVAALADESATSKTRIEALEAHCGALEARIGRLERNRKPQKVKAA